MEIVRYRVYAQLKSEAARGFLGILWWVIEPVLFMTVLYVVFSLGLRGKGPDFIPFLLSGLMVWKWFATTVGQGGRSVATSSSLMNQVYLPKWIFPAVTILTSTAKFLLALAVLLAFLLLSGIPVTPAWLALPAVLAAQLFLITAAVGIVSALVPFFPDLSLVVDTALMFLFFASGIFFDVRTAADGKGEILLFNPMALLIDNYRRVLLEGLPPLWWELGVIVGLSSVFIFLAHRIFRRFDLVYPKLEP